MSPEIVIEAAIGRPGPIQGGMVHPLLSRRQGLEPITYPSEALKTALERTLGVPVFQEQVMQIAMLAAGFTPGEADGLRRAMAAWKRKGGLEKYYHRLVGGMTERGYAQEFAEHRMAGNRIRRKVGIGNHQRIAMAHGAQDVEHIGVKCRVEILEHGSSLDPES